MDIKKLMGKYEGYLRIRIGKIRIILRLDIKNRVVYVEEIVKREKAYKKK